mgnify:FL=1
MIEKNIFVNKPNKSNKVQEDEKTLYIDEIYMALVMLNRFTYDIKSHGIHPPPMIYSPIYHEVDPLRVV